LAAFKEQEFNSMAAVDALDLARAHNLSVPVADLTAGIFACTLGAHRPKNFDVAMWALGQLQKVDSENMKSIEASTTNSGSSDGSTDGTPAAAAVEGNSAENPAADMHTITSAPHEHTTTTPTTTTSTPAAAAGPKKPSSASAAPKVPLATTSQVYQHMMYLCNKYERVDAAFEMVERFLAAGYIHTEYSLKSMLQLVTSHGSQSYVNQKLEPLYNMYLVRKVKGTMRIALHCIAWLYTLSLLYCGIWCE
jgi:hypothetical protein